MNCEIFGRWTVVGEKYIKAGNTHVDCQCACGTVKSVRYSSLVRGDTKSCGCLAKELASARQTTHGKSSHPLFQTWYDMNRRCYDTNRKDFHHYGGRGIHVCEEWKAPKFNGQGSFNNFLADMENSYEPGLEIDRVDVNGDYTPQNCRWASRSQQCKNRRDTVHASSLYDDIHNKTGLPRSVISDRINALGWSVEKTISTPIKPKRLLVESYDEELIPLGDIFSKAQMVKFSTIKKRKDIQEAVKWLFGDAAVKIYAEVGGVYVLYN